MKKITGLLMLIIIGLTLLTGCELFNGTTVSRIVKGGDWIYYTNLKEDALYKMKPDLTEKTKVSDGFGDYMVIQGDNIYFIDAESSISKIGTDGTGYTKVADVGKENMFGFNVSEDWIYYGIKSGSIYKIKTDGTAKTKIADVSSFNGDMNVSGEWIYYKDGTSLFRMRTDGTGAAKLSDNVALHEINDGWLYYCEVTEKEEWKDVYRMKPDGAEKSKLAEGSFAAIDGNWLYYSKEDWLYRANLDGSAAEKMNNVKMFSICEIYDNYIYYIEYSGAAYRINLDGSNKIRIE